MSEITKIIPKELKLLQHLRINSREKLTSISKKTKIPISTLFDLLKELNQSHIKKHTILLDFEALGYHTQANVFLKVPQEKKELLIKHLQHHPNINSVYKINNNWSFIIETIHKNVKELDNFLEKITDTFKIEKKEIHYLIEEIKKEGFEINEE